MSVRGRGGGVEGQRCLSETVEPQSRAIRVWFYFGTIFILHTILREKCTGKNTLDRAPYLRLKFLTYCKTIDTSFSLIWEPPPTPRRVGKNLSIRLQSIILLHEIFLQFDWFRAVVLYFGLIWNTYM